MSKKILLAFIYLIPQRLYGGLLKKIFELTSPQWFITILKSLFVKFYKINMAEAEFSISEYKSVQDLFCRRLKNNERSAAASSIISPVDGKITECGIIKQNKIIQAKNLDYKLSELLSNECYEKFENGWYITIYLAPYNYHRIHSPASGIINKFYYQPGIFLPVNNITTPLVKNLFVKNERITTFIETTEGLTALVKVAALGVGNIKLFYYSDDTQTAKIKNINNYKNHFTFLENNIKINKFDELGCFAFGSTVILLCEKSIKSPNFENLKNKNIKVGEAIN